MTAAILAAATGILGSVIGRLWDPGPKPLGGVETGWRAASYQSFRWEIVNALGAAVRAVGTIGVVVVALGIAVRDGRTIRAERNDQLVAQARSVVSGVPTPEVSRSATTATNRSSPLESLR
ncbi:hypothetical protein ACIBEK_07040 [Nocardia fusca]|uniref:hypothetical protein n=1 Tax=Nocardia fusca TaxID=941183 RepID=UPI0037934947